MTFVLKKYQLFLHGEALFPPFSMALNAGEIGVIAGESGSGKSTILADISGVLAPAFTSQGDIELNGQSLRNLSIEARHVGILFQDDLLFPHLSVFENLVFGLPKGLSKAKKMERVDRALADAGLPGYGPRDISTLSGGQRARISLIRTLLSEPKLILLDEPFSKLDKVLREKFRQWVFEQIAQQHIPAVLVTHDESDIPNGSQIIELGRQNA